LPAPAALDRIASSALVTLVYPSEGHHSTAREWLVQLTDQPISYTDAVSFALRQSTRCNVAMTFDRHFALPGFVLWAARRA
jgi:predicted nucleic acid-binding protein